MEYKIDFNGTELEVKEGDFILLIGKSASGKTTLLNLIEQKLKNAGEKTGFVFQNFDSQIVTDKVWHELAFGMENGGLDQKLMHRRVAELTSYFGITDWLNKDVEFLSGGQKQLLNLASVMALKPDYLLLDEPSSQLDPVAASGFFNTLKKINRELGTTIIMSEHRLEDLFAEAGKVVLLKNRKIAASGTPLETAEKILESKDEKLFEFLPAPCRVAVKAGEKNELPLTVADGRMWFKNRVKDGNCAEGVQDENRPEWSGTPRNSGQPDGESRNAPVIKIKNLSFKYKKNQDFVLRDLNLEIKKGRIFAIVGANGSGKSTLLKLLCGIEKPSSGKIKLEGSVCMMSQNVRNIFTEKTVAEEIAKAGLDKKEFEKKLTIHPYDLSSGEMQKLAFMKAVSKKTDILLLDEPTKGIDNGYKKELAKMLRGLSRTKKTIVIVSHDLEFCASAADYVSMMFEGQLCGSDTVRNFFAENNFYTTACVRMTGGIKKGIVTEDDF